jgi:hypothetical protein
MIGDDDWLNEPAKAIRGEAQPEFKAQFTSKVLVLLQRKAGASATDIFKNKALKKEVWRDDRWVEVAPDIFEDKADLKQFKKERLFDSRWKVEGHIFAKWQGVMDAINDIAAKVGHIAAKIAVADNLSAAPR